MRAGRDRGPAGRGPGAEPADDLAVDRLGRAGRHAAGRRHRDVRAESGRAGRAVAGVAGREPGAGPGVGGQRRAPGGDGDRRGGHPRVLGALPGPDGGLVTTEADVAREVFEAGGAGVAPGAGEAGGAGGAGVELTRNEVEEFLFLEARLADE